MLHNALTVRREVQRRTPPSGGGGGNVCDGAWAFVEVGMMETAKICCAGTSEIDGNGISIGEAAGMGHEWDGKKEENVRHGV